jgi:5-oxoprolinase (ATP-hydrolysing)
MWEFWIDRGGTFTDIVAKQPDGTLRTHKVLSEQADPLVDAALVGIREILEVTPNSEIPDHLIRCVKLGTTVATNALLERKGEPTLLVTNHGFQDGLRIGYQNRPELFAREIILPEQLYDHVVTVPGRFSAQGEELEPLPEAEIRKVLEPAFASGWRSCAVALLHAYLNPKHERLVAEIAREIGFTQVSVSHEVSPLIKWVTRAETAVLDAYLSPVLHRYVRQVQDQLGTHPRFLLMQSHGGLTEASLFRGKNSLLSGPAGGIVGAVAVAKQAGFSQLIAFDMGGTSTDVAHYAGELERVTETTLAGTRVSTPMLHIHTIAAGGGSLCRFDGAKLRVGPESAGANPGPCSYRRGGPLTITDCNVMVGKIQPQFFPAIFGEHGDLPLDKQGVEQAFAQLAEQVSEGSGIPTTAHQLASGFLQIACQHMAQAIKKISIERGHEIHNHVLVCFGGAGGQHACAVAELLEIKRILIHPMAGVLSALGMGLAQVRVLYERSFEQELTDDSWQEADKHIQTLEAQAREAMAAQGADVVHVWRKAWLKVLGSDTGLVVPFASQAEMRTAFLHVYRKQFGFQPTHDHLFLSTLSVELGDQAWPAPVLQLPEKHEESCQPVAHTNVFLRDSLVPVPVYRREHLGLADRIAGPAVVVENHATTMIEEGWQAQLNSHGHLLLERDQSPGQSQAMAAAETSLDPIRLELFYRRFVAIAEQMGATLQSTALSVNIKERLDFSCALFDSEARLVANAPHIPVHLGSMSASVRYVRDVRGASLRPGDAVVLNNPYLGGTHLPDITVVTPVFDQTGQQILFYMASRGHHADIGGITPGSMPPNSKTLLEEGVCLDNVLAVNEGEFQEDELRTLLTSGPYPSRNVEQNLADLRAQLAANQAGSRELTFLVEQVGFPTVQAYMDYLRAYAASQVRKVISNLDGGSWTVHMDHGAQISVTLRKIVDPRCPDEPSMQVDFTGTSAQDSGNFNTPLAVVTAAVLYVFRTLLDDEIPLNEGCLEPIELLVPEGTLLNPRYPAAVVAGNVEVSQCIVNALYGALGTMAAAQGTMNNLTFGDSSYQYYETIAGGAGAGRGFHGASGVQTHMTNSRLTDPEVLEQRFPVLVREFTIRRGSGGQGRWVGGNGVRRRLEFRKALSVAILSGQRKVAPFGLEGGDPGLVGKTWVQRAQGDCTELGACDQTDVAAGDIVVIETPGGGGFGVSENE